MMNYKGGGVSDPVHLNNIETLENDILKNICEISSESIKIIFIKRTSKKTTIKHFQHIK